MRIKDQEKIMEEVRKYLAAKDQYLNSTTPEAIAAYEAANVSLRSYFSYLDKKIRR